MSLSEIVKQVPSQPVAPDKVGNGKMTSQSSYAKVSNASTVSSVKPPMLVISNDDSASSLQMFKRVKSEEKLNSLQNGNLKPNCGLIEMNVLKEGKSRPSSAASRNWKLIQNVVIANNAIQKVSAEKQKKQVQRHMQGSEASIPVLPVPLAVCLFICNCIVPGLGTMLSSLTFCCIATTYDQPDRDLIKDKIPGMICTNMCVGIAQLCTVTFLLVGWFWSVSWGLTMVYIAMEHKHDTTKSLQHPS